MSFYFVSMLFRNVGLVSMYKSVMTDGKKGTLNDEMLFSIQFKV